MMNGYDPTLSDAMEKMNNPVVQLVKTKTDQELVDDLRKRVIEAYKPLLALCTEANHNGLILQITIGPDAFGNFTIQQCQIMKVYK